MKKNRVLAGILAISMVFIALTACGGGNNQQQQTDDAMIQSEQSAEATSEATTKQEATAAAEQEAVKEDKTLEENVNMGADANVKTSSEQVSVTAFKQSPYLDSKDLPPVAERLPKNPKIVNEIPEKHMKTEIGKYGGVLRTIRMDPVWDAVLWTVQEEPLVNSPGRLVEEITPNLVESFEVSDDLSTYSFKLREGMKWSDGEPLTTEDVRFGWEDYRSNEDLTPLFPNWLRTGNDPEAAPGELIIHDDYNFTIRFDGPYGGFLIRLTTANYAEFIQPSHHMKQYHAKYADPAELAALVEKYGYQEGEWYNLYEFAMPTSWNNGRVTQLTTPTLGPYVLSVEETDPRKYVRNPYYFKIDAEGNQLPYIDECDSYFVTNMESAGVKILGGEIDFAYEWVPLDKVALYKDNEEKGGYRLLTNTALHRTAADILFNLTYEDETWRSVVRDIRFRQALNYALNKQDIVDTVYYGFAYVSDMQESEFNLDKANALLDEMGMERGADGYRNAPNGEQFTIEFNYSDWMTQYAPTAMLAAEHWRLLDLRVNLKQMDNTLLDRMAESNELQVTTAFSHGPVFAMWDDWAWNRWGRLWYLNFETGGKEGETPPPEVSEFYKTVYSIAWEDPANLPQIRQKMRDLQRDNLYYLLPIENITQLSLINKDLKNFPDAGYLLCNSYAAEQWWFDR